jgi:hypothetical protein
MSVTYSDTRGDHIHHVKTERVGTRLLRTCMMVDRFNEAHAISFERAAKDMDAWAAEARARETEGGVPYPTPRARACTSSADAAKED